MYPLSAHSQKVMQLGSEEARRFSDKDVEVDAEAVARAIARELNLEYEFSPRKATGSGMSSITQRRRGNVLQRLHPPAGRVGNEPWRVSGEGLWSIERSLHPPSPKARSSPSTLPEGG